MESKSYSVVIPAYNESGAIAAVLEEIFALLQSGIREVIVVDDHSTDGTREMARLEKVTVLSNVQNFGYGYSLKKGITAAKHEHIVILDADGSYPVSEIPKLMREYEKGFDMIVGARQGAHYHGSLLKRLARLFFRLISEFTTGRHIPDINSGFRIFRKDLAMNYFHTLSSGFSFTTTITLAFMLNAHSVQYMPIAYHKRSGRSKVKYLRDTLRSAQIIVEAITHYNPLKLFILCGIAILFSGVLSLVLGLIIPVWVALLVFSMLVSMILVFALGLVTTFLKFMHNGRS
jgi:glycosyltransferase involved in cell wall biosynthesis